ncbi:MAG: PQQ-binding-like beta-propeller repeat protein [Nanoarchaeota archaeon]|nr:PQQ-binding-like beta-propeller repeat protein [Nanoarchaeota archaeon]
MVQYDLGTGNLAPTFDTSEFSDVELTATLSQYKASRSSYWENIGVGGSFTAAPLIHRNTVYVGCHDKNFYALTMDGKEKWRFGANANFSWQASTDGDTIYVGCYDHNLYAFDAATGTLKWKFATNDIVIAAPSFHEDRAYFGSGDSNIYCVDCTNGKELWRFHTNGVAFSVTVKDNCVYSGYGDGVFYCLDLDGHEVWRFKTSYGRVMAYPPAFMDDLVFISSDDRNVYALDKTTGTVRWKFSALDTTYTPHYFDGRIFIGSRDFNFYCLDAKTGKQQWKFKTNHFSLDILPGPDITYGASWDTNLYALATATGTLLWKFQTDGFVGFLAKADDKVFFGSWDGNVYCLDKDGHLLWKFRSTMSSPSTIAPPETGFMKSVEVVVHQEEDTPEIDRYKERFAEEGGGSTVYTFKTQYTRKGRYATK